MDKDEIMQIITNISITQIKYQNLKRNNINYRNYLSYKSKYVELDIFGGKEDIEYMRDGQGVSVGLNRIPPFIDDPYRRIKDDEDKRIRKMRTYRENEIPEKLREKIKEEFERKYQS